MTRAWGKKRFYPVLTAYLAIAVMGAFTLSMAESLRLDDPEKDHLSGGSYTALHTTIDWLLEDSSVIGRAGGHYSSPLGNGLLREFTSAGIENAAASPSGSLLQTGKNHKAFAKKPVVLPKLRI